MKTSLNLIFLLLLFFSIFSCKDDDIAVDPCADEVATSAEFDFFVRALGKDSIYWMPVIDTFYNSAGGGGTDLYFRAQNSQMTYYNWTIGQDSRIFTDSVFKLAFEGIEGNVDANLKVGNDGIIECVADSTATSTQSIYMKSFSMGNIPIFGTYEGADEDTPDDIYSFDILFFEGLQRFPNNCTILSNSGIHVFLTGRSFVIDKYGTLPYLPNSCGRPSGEGTLQDDNKTLIFDYTIEYDDNSQEKVTKRFIGTKI